MKELNRTAIEEPKTRTWKVLQFGGGNFMRAYLDWMVQQMNDYANFAGGVVVIKPTAGGGYDVLESQEGLYHVKTSGYAKGKIIDQIEMIRCIDKIVSPYQDYDEYLHLAEVKSLKFIFSNTTESGIVYDDKDGPDLIPPVSFPGKLCAFLKARFDFCQADLSQGFIILPCELIEDNGNTLKEIIIRLATKWYQDSRFLEWIEQANLFANTLVDRIVPGSPSAEEISRIQNQIGFRDRAIVTGEPYHLLVIEGAKNLEALLPLQEAGINVVYTDDLSLYRLLKVRLLNGAHTALVPTGLLLGLSSVRDCIEHKYLAGFLDRLLKKEITVVLGRLEEGQVSAYIDDLLDRFRNPFVDHHLSSIALNSISKFRVRLLPTLKEYLAQYDEYPDCLMLSFACLLRFYQGDWEGHKLPLKDSPEIIERFKQIWSRNESDLQAFSQEILSQTDLWGEDLSLIENMVRKVSDNLHLIAEGNLGKELFRLSSGAHLT